MILYNGTYESLWRTTLHRRCNQQVTNEGRYTRHLWLEKNLKSTYIVELIAYRLCPPRGGYVDHVASRRDENFEFRFGIRFSNQFPSIFPFFSIMYVTFILCRYVTLEIKRKIFQMICMQDIAVYCHRNGNIAWRIINIINIFLCFIYRSAVERRFNFGQTLNTKSLLIVGQ